MIARLQSFYKGPADGWLKVPIGMLQILDNNLPKLEARHQLSLHSLVMSATGNMKKEDSSSLQRALVEVAEYEKTPATKPKTLSDIAALGIEVIEEPVEQSG